MLDDVDSARCGLSIVIAWGVYESTQADHLGHGHPLKGYALAARWDALGAVGCNARWTV